MQGPPPRQRERWTHTPELLPENSGQLPGAPGCWRLTQKEKQRRGGTAALRAQEREDRQHAPHTGERNKLSEGSPHAPLRLHRGNRCSKERGHVQTHTCSPAAGTIRPECRVTPGQQAGGPGGRTGPWTRTRRLCWGGHTTPSGTHERKWKGGSHHASRSRAQEGTAGRDGSRKRTFTTGNWRQPVEEDEP